MKKMFYSFLAVAMFAGVVSCGSQEEAPIEEAPVEVVEEAVVEEVAPVEEVVDSAAAVVEEVAAH